MTSIYSLGTPVAQFRTTATPPPPQQPPPAQPQDESFLSRYACNVKKNVEEDGVGWTLLASGLHGFIGGILGGLGGAFLGAVLPAPVGPIVGTTLQVAGALGGFAYRLGRSRD